MEHSDTPESSLISDIGSDDIAIIGIACRFPGGASDTQKFWELLHDKRCESMTSDLPHRPFTFKFYNSNL